MLSRACACNTMNAFATQRYQRVPMDYLTNLLWYLALPPPCLLDWYGTLHTIALKMEASRKRTNRRQNTHSVTLGITNR